MNIPPHHVCYVNIQWAPTGDYREATVFAALALTSKWDLEARKEDIWPSILYVDYGSATRFVPEVPHCERRKQGDSCWCYPEELEGVVNALEEEGVAFNE